MTISVTTFGKINLSLRSGPVDEHGYHPLRTVFASLDLRETISVTPASEFTLRVANDPAGLVPLDESNLATRAAKLLAERVGRRPDVAIEIVKGVPVAGGMGGGSADAAGALLALNELWEIGLHPRQLAAIARPLGADVPFAVLGGVALGTGRGDSVQPVPSAVPLHFALAFQDEGISTAGAYRAYDALSPRALNQDAESALLAALAAGDLLAIGAELHNDLQPVALQFIPRLAQVMDLATGQGALGVIVSGSGPSVAALARDADHAAEICAAWLASGTVSGARTAVTVTPDEAREASSATHAAFA
ncbi:4-(cytidine 5'-diphospho)-2-C-methyl-D-erythritol kinase [Rarobacter faecitabidus]|uniref:4-diphosphocytidyl-2-C-methyl-D-erythritol kinase n=1 Tax=Rarobacter faecitabidus TaxID=13243 RepID=A0A542ZUD2_RARFA|nr:4-(cytidine 5'-diphospho)-2-C-methyl-D-erythritol kinase [Rarobacter faecitabidus]TQL63800.1 4-diphosphocytidyl-2-C-methyl-D-erythritol kinase [Rarobacter faecitabidus]